MKYLYLNEPVTNPEILRALHWLEGQVRFYIQNRSTISEFGLQCLIELEKALQGHDLDKAIAICEDSKLASSDRTLPHKTFRRWLAKLYALKSCHLRGISYSRGTIESIDLAISKAINTLDMCIAAYMEVHMKD